MVEFVGVNRFQSHFLGFEIEKKLHIGGQGEEITISPNVIIAKFDEVFHTILLRVFPYSGYAFGLSGPSLHLNGDAFAF